MAIVRPGNEGVMATVITRRGINPTRKKVRLMTWARPYANVSRFGTGREQGSHLIRVRSWESELENGFDTAPILRGPGGNVADPRDRGRVAPSVNILSGLDGCYHKRAGIKIGPSTRIDCSSEISQTFLWGPPDTGPSRPRFPPGKTRRHAVRGPPVDREQADRELPPADPFHGPFHGPGVQPPPGEARRGEARRDRRPRRDRQDRPEERGRHPLPAPEDQRRPVEGAGRHDRDLEQSQV